ncbi:S8 family serine peptidase [Pseudonocardia sp.]|uniref:S8 family serine peptidase n=1 Tax=Pseudonocardia sp. TaxID=60912 RepID=UPI003D0D5C3B
MPDGRPPVGGTTTIRPERELIVVAEVSARLTATATGLEAPGAQSAADELSAVLAAEDVILEPLFLPNEEAHRARAYAAASPEQARIEMDLASFYRVRAEDGRLDDLAARLREAPLVAAAYVKPPTEPATLTIEDTRDELRRESPSATPDFTVRQGYLGPAPGGVEAIWAAAQPGGRGDGVGVVDVEGEWRFTHEDLAHNAGGLLAGAPANDLGWRNHGTAVIGEIGGDENDFGVLGIAPGAVVRGASIFGGTGSAGAIVAAANALNAGDVILLELHRAGPRFDFEPRSDQRGYIAIEWWPDDLAAVRYAVGRGVVVVGAAGNGAEDLDDAIYGAVPAGFPADWRNPFDPANPGSGAVIVGAGAPPPGTHGANHGPDRSRLGFSNFGARLDAQGWGREVTTTGYGDLQGGADEDSWYTDRFSGTSSASPIVVGAVAALQGMQEAAGRPRLTPARAVEVLRATGSPQQDGPNGPASQRIGNRPDLRAAAQYLVPAATNAGVATLYWAELVPIPAGSPRLWLFVDGGWRRLDSPSDLVTRQAQGAFLGADSVVRAWYQGDLIVGLVVSGS